MWRNTDRKPANLKKSKIDEEKLNIVCQPWVKELCFPLQGDCKEDIIDWKVWRRKIQSNGDQERLVERSLHSCEPNSNTGWSCWVGAPTSISCGNMQCMLSCFLFHFLKVIIFFFQKGWQEGSKPNQQRFERTRYTQRGMFFKWLHSILFHVGGCFCVFVWDETVHIQFWCFVNMQGDERPFKWGVPCQRQRPRKDFRASGVEGKQKYLRVGCHIVCSSFQSSVPFLTEHNPQRCFFTDRRCLLCPRTNQNCLGPMKQMPSECHSCGFILSCVQFISVFFAVLTKRNPQWCFFTDRRCLLCPRTIQNCLGPMKQIPSECHSCGFVLLLCCQFRFSLPFLTKRNPQRCFFTDRRCLLCPRSNQNCLGPREQKSSECSKFQFSLRFLTKRNAQRSFITDASCFLPPWTYPNCPRK